MKYCGIVQSTTLYYESRSAQLACCTSARHTVKSVTCPLPAGGVTVSPRPLHPTSQPVMRKKSAENFKLLIAPIGGNMTRSLYFLGSI
jgi:hypothetical protein